MKELSDENLLYYSKHIFLDEIGAAGQELLSNSSVTIFGLGGLGSLFSMYAASCGIGNINIVDFDIIEKSNLQRQLIYNNEDLKKKKVDITYKKLSLINPSIQISKYDTQIKRENDVLNITKKTDIVIDATDNFLTRKVINRSCVNRLKLISGSVESFSGQIFTYFPNNNHPCYECIFPDLYDDRKSCAEEGVFAPTVGLISIKMIIETIKILLKKEPAYLSKLYMTNTLSNESNLIEIKQDKDCFCSTN